MLPENDGTEPEIVTLRKMLHKELLADGSIISLGGSQSTPINDILLLKYDADYEELIVLLMSVRLRSLMIKIRISECVKLRKTEIFFSHELPANQQLPDNTSCKIFSTVLIATI